MENKNYEISKFSGKNVPVKEAAKLMGKDQQFVRQGIIRGLLPIGVAFKKQLLIQSGERKKNLHNMTFLSVHDYYGNIRV